MNRPVFLAASTLAALLALVLVAGCDVSARPTPRPVQSLLEPPPSQPVNHFGVTQAGYAAAEAGQPPSALPFVPVSPQNDQEAAADALARIGAPAAPSLMAALQNHDPAVRRQAAKVLARMGPEAREAAAQLTRLLDDPDPSVRLAAAAALGHIGPEAAVAVPALMRNLVQGDPLPPGVSSLPPRGPEPSPVAPAALNLEIPMPPSATFGPPASAAPTGPTPVAPVQPLSVYQP